MEILFLGKCTLIPFDSLHPFCSSPTRLVHQSKQLSQDYFPLRFTSTPDFLCDRIKLSFINYKIKTTKTTAIPKYPHYWLWQTLPEPGSKTVSLVMTMLLWKSTSKVRRGGGKGWNEEVFSTVCFSGKSQLSLALTSIKPVIIVMGTKQLCTCF